VIGQRKRVFIVGNQIKDYALLFQTRNLQFMGTRKIEEADVVVFTGGADINPRLYGERAIPSTAFSETRDTADMAAWHATQKHQVCVGICRGAQFLNVMCGGTLWQDISHHKYDHHIIDRMTGTRVWATSTHHQQMIPGEGARIVATAGVAMTKKSDGAIWTRPVNQMGEVISIDGDRVDYEVIEYPERNVLCFQPHPEIDRASLPLRNYFFNRLGIMLASVKRD